MDEMTIINPTTGKDKIEIDSNNNVTEIHTCSFKYFDDNEKCIYCGISLGEFIDSNKGTPLIINPMLKENK